MIISGATGTNRIKAYGDQIQTVKSGKDTASIPSQGQDQFILSPGAQEFGQVFQNIKGMSDVRDDKVKEFSDKINTGMYQVDSRKIADQMVGGTVVNGYY